MPSTPSIASPRSIHQSFDLVRARKSIGLVPFVPAGYPDLATTALILKAMDAAGAAVIEIGFPFSDPVADGPIIQEAFTEALAKKLKVADIFRMVKSVSSGLSAPLVAMVSHSIVFRYGAEKFFADARSAGFAGMIIPDLPPPEAQRTCRQIRSAGLDTILLVAPTTTVQRRKEIAELCTGFVYYMSISGITGERTELPPDLTASVAQLRKLTDQPVCVGFGISKPAHLQNLRGIADGAIVGSAIVRVIKSAAGKSGDAIAAAVLDYCKSLTARDGI